MKALVRLVLLLGAVTMVLGCDINMGGCMQDLVIIDSVKTPNGADTTWRVDTLAIVKICGDQTETPAP